MWEINKFYKVFYRKQIQASRVSDKKFISFIIIFVNSRVHLTSLALRFLLSETWRGISFKGNCISYLLDLRS